MMEERETAERQSFGGWIMRLLGLEMESKPEIYAGVASSATLRDGTYWLEILFSAGIATLGLILNSPAVIIGAMLISPLMGPILANGLALAAGDFVLALRALSNLLISALAAVGFATLLVVLLPFREMTAEIAARTQPNTLDLVIALFSGAIGSVAICKSVRGVATSLPGVAIAVALMPPLCVVGYGIGLIFMVDPVEGERVLRGGGLLFLTNLVAITFTAMLVFLLFRVGSAEVRERVRALNGDRRGMRIPLPAALVRIGSLPARIILVALFIASLVAPLSRSLDSLKHEIAHRQFENRLQKTTHQIWDESFARGTTGDVRSYLDTVSASEERGRLSVHIRIFTSGPYSPQERAEFVRRLSAALGRDPRSVDLSLIEIPTSRFEVASRTRSEEIAPAAPAPPAPPATSAVIADLRRRIEQAVEGVRLPEPALLDQETLSVGPGAARIELAYVSPRDIDPDGQALLIDRIRSAVGDASIDVLFERHPASAAVAFGRRSSMLSDAAMSSMRLLADVAARHPEWTVTIAAPAEDRTREDRIAAIRKQLTASGIDASRMATADAVTGGDYEVRIGGR